MSSESESDDDQPRIEIADELRGDDFFLCGIKRHLTSRGKVLELAQRLVPGKKLASYTGAKYAAKKQWWTVVDSVFALTPAGEKELEKLERRIPIGLMTTIDTTCKELANDGTSLVATEAGKEASPRTFVLEVGAQIEVKAHLDKSANSRFSKASTLLRDEWDLPPPTSRTSIASLFQTEASVHLIRSGGAQGGASQTW